MTSGALSIVATPIGNLGDITHRAVKVLAAADHLVVEDTRRARQLLQHLTIPAPAMTVMREDNTARQVPVIISALQAGKQVALISDAGTPLISDPGQRLVEAAIAAGITVTPVPGACALVAALSAAGISIYSFVFEGFLSPKGSERMQQLQGLKGEVRTLVFYEAPHRVLSCVQVMCDVFGAERRAVLARELTKLHETFLRLPLGELAQRIAEDPNQQRGECVLIVEGADIDNSVEEVLPDAVVEALREMVVYMPVKAAAKVVSKLTGLAKNRLYEAALGLGKGKRG